MPAWFDNFFPPPAADSFEVAGKQVPLLLVRNPRARRYLLRLRRDGAARVTVPRGGSLIEARRFAIRNLAWIETQLNHPHRLPPKPPEWRPGSEVLFRGELVRLEVGSGADPLVCLGPEKMYGLNLAVELRPAVEKYLRGLAARELPRRVMELSSGLQLSVRQVTVRNQRTRWGSCSRRGTISLNWRLIQTPRFVSDYIILHELMHLREMNHSKRFWREVEIVCPDYRSAEQWLKQHAGLLRP